MVVILEGMTRICKKKTYSEDNAEDRRDGFPATSAQLDIT